MSKLADCLKASSLSRSFKGAIKAQATKVENTGVPAAEAEKRAVQHFLDAAIASRTAIVATLKAKTVDTPPKKTEDLTDGGLTPKTPSSPEEIREGEGDTGRHERPARPATLEARVGAAHAA